MKFLKIFFLFLWGFFFQSCGKKAPPIPIKESLPKEVTFSISATPFGFDLLIELPSETKGNYPLTKIKTLIIEKKEINLENPKNIKIKEIKLKPKLHSAGRLIVYSDSELKSGFQYSYRLKIKKDLFVETPFSEEKVVFWTTPPSVIKNLSIKIDEPDILTLNWDFPTYDLKGKPLREPSFFRIERYSEDKIKNFEVNQNFFRDKIEPSSKVCYRIQALINFRGTIIPGLKSEFFCYP